MMTLWQDFRYGCRMLRRQPLFSAIAILTLALGIGANSAIFSVVNAVLLRPLPFKEPDRLIKLWETFLPGGQGTVSVPNLKDWREQNDVFTEIAAYQFGNFNLQGSDNPERVQGATVSANMFTVLGVEPQLGRGFLPEEDQPGHRVVVLSNQLWKRNFSSDPQILGKDIALGGEGFTVVGVMPAGFQFPRRTTELWVPLVTTPVQNQARGSHFLFALGRLKPGVSEAQAEEQMRVIASRLEQQYPEEQSGRSVLLIPLQEEMVRNVRPALLILLGAVGFVLLIACTNVANLLLARAAGRRREIAIRSALGAGRGRLMRQFLTESVLLGLLGGVVGLALAKIGLQALVTLAASFLPRADEVTLDGRVLGFTLLLSLVTGIGFGLAPALQVSRSSVQDVLKESGSSGNSARRNWLRSILVVVEVAAALVLLVGSGLLIKSFFRLQQVDTGLRPENVMTMGISLPDAKYPTPETAALFYKQVLDRVTTLPGVQSAGIINLLPVQSWGFNGDIEIEGQGPYPPGQAPLAEFRSISPDYFRALGVPLVSGRFFNDRDNQTGAPVIIINQTLARDLMPHQDPIGKRIRGLTPDWATVIGVVGDVRQSGLTNPTRPEIFFPYTQDQASALGKNMSMVARATNDPTSLVSAIRAEVLAVDPAQPIYNVKTMQDVIADSVSNSRLNMVLLTIFAAVALVLAMIGIYSVMSYTVNQSTREIGIRMALGARPGHVLKLVVGHGLLLAVIGVVIGAVCAFALTRLMSSLLYGVTATDPVIFSAVSLAIMIVAVMSSYIPARRAIKVDPMIALRYE